MEYLEVIGKKNINGEVLISGSKNSALPLLANTILSSKPVNIYGGPNVNDIRTFLKLLSNLGACCDFKKDCITVNPVSIKNYIATYDIVKTMRASILVLAPILARLKKCKVSLPGGCAIGERPIDLHLKALSKMGVTVSIKKGYINASLKKTFKASDIVFEKITVTGSENIIMAAALAKGKSHIINVAQEPEVIQLCETLKESGIEIDGIGSNELTISGTNGELLPISDSKVIPDRIEAGTYLCAGAITNSSLTIKNVIPEHINAVISKLKDMGFKFNIKDNTITILPSKKILPIEIATSTYPAFPTDMQAQFMALATQANGSSIIEEKLFENRFMHVGELRRMGANIVLKGNVATIIGPSKLFGAEVMATDLRASSALVIASLCAHGKTSIHRLYHLDRGYENIERKLSLVNANIKRLTE